MKRLLLIFFVLFAIGLSNIYAQKCKVENDPITNEEIISYNFKEKSIYFESKNDSLLFEIRCNYKGNIKVAIPEGSEIFFKLKDGEIIKLKTIEEAIPKSHAYATQYSAGVYSTCQFKMRPTKEVLKKLSAAKLALIRYPNPDGGHLDQEISFLSAKVLMKGANCILSNTSEK